MVASSRGRTLEDWLTRLESLHPKKIDLGLDRVGQVLAALSLREPPYRIITIGGTNGKGSCVALLENIYREAGYRVGAFTSPHLWRFNERIRVGGMEATDAELIALFEAIDAGRGEVTLSYFEYSAVAALLQFARQGVELALLEVGLGGRLDAVNAVDADVSVVTSVALDHQVWLGETRDAIGREKAGILRRARPGVVAERAPPRGLLAEAERLGAELRLIGRDFDGRAQPDTGDWLYRGWTSVETVLPMPAFGGQEQLENAAACVAVIQCLGSSLPVDADVLVRGLAGAWLPGRIEHRTIGDTAWVFDVAHNPVAAVALAKELARLPALTPTVAVVGVMSDKDIPGVLAPLIPVVDEWVVTQADPQRGATAESLAAALADRGITGVSVEPGLAEACRAARARARPGGRVLVFGSFYTVGPAMSALGLYCAPSQPGDVPARWTAD